MRRDHSIISDESLSGIKRTVEVRLEERVSQDTLEAMAHALSATDPSSYDRTFILYYLPEMEVGAGAWATTHFDPNLDVHILGLTVEEFDSMNAVQTDDPNREVVGRWLDDRPYVNQGILIFREAGTLFLESSYPDGSSGVEEMVETKLDAGLKIEKIGGSDFGDHFLLTNAGALEIRDSEGLIATATRLD